MSVHRKVRNKIHFGDEIIWTLLYCRFVDAIKQFRRLKTLLIIISTNLQISDERHFLISKEKKTFKMLNYAKTSITFAA